MKIVVLQGGAAGTARPTAATSRTAYALGDRNGRWLLLNISPAVALQLASDAQLDRHPGLRDPESRMLALTDAQIDHVAGLLSLRDGSPIELYATPSVFEDLTVTLPVLPALQHYCGVHWHVVPVAGDSRIAAFRIEAMPTLEFTAIATQIPTPPHLGRGDAGVIGDGIALAVRDCETGKRAFCVPGSARLGAFEFDWMREADCLLIDEPLYEADAPAPESRIDRLGRLPAPRKLLSGDWDRTTDERLRERGMDRAYDGMAIEL